MSIVLPRRKKKTDIFAPRKSVQDAKEKLGPAYFDPSLLECSRNAVELNKLVNKWDDIDKQKVKVIRDLSREQITLARTFKRNHSFGGFSTKDASSEECLETLDGKMIPPGFRFKSNGEFKVSATSLPHLSVSFSDEDIKTTNKESKEDNSNYCSIDYNKEIAMLRDVIIDICEELSRSKISLSKSSSGNLKSFLRAHSNEYTSVSDYTGELYEKPNDRFAFQPGSSEKRNLHKQRIKTPSSRVCVGCQFKLKQQNDELQKIKISSDKTILKRRWSYVPTGKYVTSSTSVNLGTHLLNYDSNQLSNDMNSCYNKPGEDLKPSLVQCKADSEINPRKTVSFQHKFKEKPNHEGRTKSSPCVRQTGSSTSEKYYRSYPLIKTRLQPGVNKTRSRSATKTSAPTSGSSTYSDPRQFGLDSSLSLRSGLSSRPSSRLLADYDSRLDLLKQYQVQLVFNLYLI